MKKETWVKVDEANKYFSKKEEAALRWNKLDEHEKQLHLGKAYQQINESALYRFPDNVEQTMKKAQCEQALFFFNCPEDMQKAFETALPPHVREILKSYSTSITNRKIKSINWHDSKDFNLFLEEKFGLGLYEFNLSLIYINRIRSMQNEFYRRETVIKFIKDLKSFAKRWIVITDEKYPSMTNIPSWIPLKIHPPKLYKSIYKKINEINEIIGKLNSPRPLRNMFMDEDRKITMNRKSCYIKPQNLIILVWAKALKKGEINWKIMLNFLNAQYIKLKKIVPFADIFDDLKKEKLHENPETLRQIYNKYTNPKSYGDREKYNARMELINSIYLKSFVEKISPF